MRTHIRVGLVTLAVALATAAASGSAQAATTYYVAPGGANGNPGTSAEPLGDAPVRGGPGRRRRHRDRPRRHLRRVRHADDGHRHEPDLLPRGPGRHDHHAQRRDARRDQRRGGELHRHRRLHDRAACRGPGIRSAVNDHVTIRHNTCDGNGRWGIFTGLLRRPAHREQRHEPLARSSTASTSRTAATGPSSAATSSSATTPTAST